jgi:hypothetical protein
MSARIAFAVLLFVSAFTPLYAADTLLITEFMAVNSGPSGLADEDGDFEDWIEIHNPGTNSVSINGWYLTDTTNNLTKWQFPATNVAPNGYLVVFASNKDRRVPGRPLHTNFRLDAGGEFLGLIRPDGTNIAHAYSPRYTNQVQRISYGIPVVQTLTTLISSGAAARVYIPSNNALAETWIQPSFDHSTWMPATTGIGFETDNQGAFTPAVIANSTSEFSGKQGSNNWYYGYWDKQADPNGTYSDIDMSFFPNANEAYGSNNYWNGTMWDWFNGDPPFTQISAGGAIANAPNGIPGRANHWAIRRYVSEWSGPIKITGQITHTSDWVYVTATGVAANSLLYLYLTAAGDGYIDDLKLVAGSVPEVGPNLMPNGDFESALTGPWTVSANHSASAIVTDVKHGGASSLHMVASVGGTTQASAIWQTIAPALTVGNTYTLSYWFKPGSVPSPIIVRFSGDWIRTQPAFCGDGVTARIFVDGNQVFQQAAYVSSPTYSITVPVSIGSRVDFALDPGTNDLCDASGFTAQIETADPANTTVADSVADWSTSGTQGEKNWYYGYYNRTTDPGGVYAAGDFIQFPRNPGAWSANNFWDGSKWDWFAGNPPWDEIGVQAVHPNGINNAAEHWVIRRWSSEVSGRIVVDWRMAKSNPAGNGVTGRLFHNGVQLDTAAIGGTDTVGVNRSVTITNVNVGDFIDLALDPTGPGGDTGDGSDGSINSMTIRGAPSLTQSIATDVRTIMQNINSTAYIRVPFEVTNVAAMNFLTLRMKYDDGFVAYLNGVQVAGRNYSFFPDPLTWNSVATATRADSDVNEGEDIDISGFAGLIQPGTNVLAIHGLNFTAADSDFLILPELRGAAVSLGSTPSYFAAPTPGTANGAASTNIGPIIVNADHTPNVPLDNENLIVTARVLPSFFPVGTVTLVYRTMFSNEVSVQMFDDGAHGDGAGADQVFGATIPATAAEPGQMIRYYVSAADIRTNLARFPYFEGPVSLGTQKGTPEYLGTIVYLPQTNSLPMLHWFIATPTGANNDNGTRCSIFWDGQFRDNVGVTLHGQSSSGFPKRAHNFNLNSGYKLEARPGEPDISDFAILSTWADRSHIRNAVNTETYHDAGTPAHYSFPIRVQQNGTFYAVANWIEQGNNEYLERIGYDPNGALYKMYNTFTGAAGNEKKTRKNDPTGTADLQSFWQALQDTGTRIAYIYDNVNMPSSINFLAAKQVGSDHDCCHKNYYLYRDSDGSGEWYSLPWDFDLSYGHIWTSGNGNYFDDSMYTNGTITTTTYMAGNNMTLYGIMFNDPAMRQMWNRRVRTLIDQILQPPGTSTNADYLRAKIDYWANLTRADATLDKVRWGGATWVPPLGGIGPANPTTTNPTNNFEIELTRLKDYYLPGRRTYLSTIPVAGIPLAQPANTVINFGSFDYSPASTNQAQEYVELINTNSYAVDISGWRIEGGIQFTFPPGTVIPTLAAGVSNRLYISPDVKAFRARTTGPRGGQRNFVIGPYDGQLSARGESLVLINAAGLTNSSLVYTGAPSAAQQYLRITELMYHPPVLPGDSFPAEEYEYIELKNIGPTAIHLNGVHFTNGIVFAFSVANTTNLNAGATIILAKNPVAFAARYPSVIVPVFAYVGSLENNGETIQIDDAVGEKILEFTYNNTWHPLTAGNGFSLVIIDENGPFNSWNDKDAWRASGVIYGSPGVTDPAPPEFPTIIVNEVLAHTDFPDVDSIELHNATTNAVDVGDWWLSDDRLTPKKYRIPAPRLILPGQYAVFTESDFGVGPNQFRFSSTDDEAYIFSGNSDGQLTGYYFGYHFEASANGVSFGRYTNSQGEVHFVAQSSNTFGFPNAAPKVGPIVLSEINYRPPDIGGLDNTVEEFVELHNITTNNVPLYDPLFPTNRWRLQDGIEFSFSTNDTIPANGFLVVVSFPLTNATQLANFRIKYGVPTNVAVVGPYSGKLDNSGETVELYRPDTPNSNGVPFILVERLRYADLPPWDVGADGFGPSLQRRVLSDYANDPTNWFAALPNAGRPASTGEAPIITTQPQSITVTEGVTTNLALTVTGTPPLGYQWRRNGVTLTGETNSFLSFTNIQPGQTGVYAVIVFNAAGVAYSSNAVLIVRPLPIIVQQPISQGVQTNATVTNSVFVTGTGTILYQWYFNGTIIAGATNSSFVFSNAELFAHSGHYSVRITDEVASLLSQTATVVVLVRPAFTNLPVSQVIVRGGNAFFSVVAGPNHPLLPLSYRWLTNGVAYQTSLRPDVVITNRQTTTTVRCVLTNLAATVAQAGSANLTVLADADGDGMADIFEQQYGLTNAADATLDADGDGMNNRDELIAGTNPTNALSVLKILTSLTNDTLLEFVAQTNNGYQLQYRTNLETAPWITLTTVPPHISVVRTIQFEAPKPPPEGKRYYRVATPPLP